jgi:hypothetical protein
MRSARTWGIAGIMVSSKAAATHCKMDWNSNKGSLTMVHQFHEDMDHRPTHIPIRVRKKCNELGNGRLQDFMEDSWNSL